MTLVWRDVAALLSLLIGLQGAWLFAIQWLLNRTTKHIDQRLDLLTGEHRLQTERLHQVEKDVLKLRAEIAERYVGREDWIRFGTNIQVKIDGIALSVEDLKERIRDANGPVRETA